MQASDARLSMRTDYDVFADVSDVAADQITTPKDALM